MWLARCARRAPSSGRSSPVNPAEPADLPPKDLRIGASSCPDQSGFYMRGLKISDKQFIPSVLRPAAWTTRAARYRRAGDVLHHHGHAKALASSSASRRAAVRAARHEANQDAYRLFRVGPAARRGPRGDIAQSDKDRSVKSVALSAEPSANDRGPSHHRRGDYSCPARFCATTRPEERRRNASEIHGNTGRPEATPICQPTVRHRR
jgi:hypothetical protein